MSNDEITPIGLEPDSDGVNEWVRFQLTRIHDRTRAIENKMIEVCAKHSAYDEFITETKIRLAEGVKTFQNYDERFDSINKQIDDLRAIRNNPKKNNDKNSDVVTFKYLVDKLGAPVVSSVITAILIAALMYWILNASTP